MALLTATQPKGKKNLVTISIDHIRRQEITAYCTWAGIGRINEFMLQAADYILKNDKDWKKFSQTKEDSV